MTATPLLGIYKNVFLNDSEPEILACVFYLYIFNKTGVLLDGTEDLQASQRTVILPFNLKWQACNQNGILILSYPLENN